MTVFWFYCREEWCRDVLVLRGLRLGDEFIPISPSCIHRPLSWLMFIGSENKVQLALCYTNRTFHLKWMMSDRHLPLIRFVYVYIFYNDDKSNLNVTRRWLAEITQPFSLAVISTSGAGIAEFVVCCLLAVVATWRSSPSFIVASTAQEITTVPHYKCGIHNLPQ